MNKRGGLSQQGFAMGFVAILVLALTSLILFIAEITKSSTLQTTYMDVMNDVYSEAESGLANAISELVYKPELCLDVTWEIDLVNSLDPRKESRTTCQFRDIPGNDDIYYLTTVAKKTVGGKTYSQELHSYVAISNVAEYFAASSADLTIARGSNLGTGVLGGKVYAARNLVFSDGPGTDTTFAQKAEFYGTVTPALTVNNNTEWPASEKAKFNLTFPANNSPVKLSAPRLFPEVTLADLERYKALAGPHIVTSNFSHGVYPPGYAGYASNEPDDLYPNHTNVNEHHIYYYGGDMHIGTTTADTTFYGQVLFVSTGDIYINGNLVVASSVLPVPGAGSASSSTVHQCPVLIPGPGKNVYINNVFFSTVAYVGGATTQTQTIHALIMAFSGRFIATAYQTTGKYNPALIPGPPISVNLIHNQLKLDFEGAMLVGNTPDLAPVFVGGRTYKYMQSLKTHPPPYLPAISFVHTQISLNPNIE